MYVCVYVCVKIQHSMTFAVGITLKYTVHQQEAHSQPVSSYAFFRLQKIYKHLLQDI